MRWRTAAAVALLATLVLAWCATLAAALWFDLEAAERAALATLAPLLRSRGGLVWLFLLALPLLLWVVVRPWIAAWPRAAKRLREEVALAAEAPAGARITVAGAHGMRELAQAVDGLAQAHAALQGDVQARVDQSLAALANETRRLAALMSQLPRGVLVCNVDGRVLLCNARAAALLGALGQGGDDATLTPGLYGEGAPLGLGRSVGTLLDAAAIEHAWQRVRRQLEAGEARAVANFVTACRWGAEGQRRPVVAKATADPPRESAEPALLRVQMVPTQGASDEPTGYLLLIDDITHAVQTLGQRDAMLARLTEGMRAALANLRTGAEALRHEPAMALLERERFTAVVHDEAERLARHLEEALRQPNAGSAAAGWPLEELRAADLVLALDRSLRAEPMRDGIGRPLACRLEGAGELRLMADSLALVGLLSHLVRRLASELAARDFWLAVHPGARAVRLELGWAGPPLPPGGLEAWEQGGLDAGAATAGAGDPPQRTPLREVLDRHGAELWSVPAEGGAQGRQRLCLQLGASSIALDAPHVLHQPGAPVATLAVTAVGPAIAANATGATSTTSPALRGRPIV